MNAVRVAAIAIVAILSTVANAGEAPTLRRAGYLGVQVGLVTGEVRQRLKLGPAGGVLVQGLLANGAAGDAGLQVDDVLLALGGKPIADNVAFVGMVGRMRAGDRVRLDYERAGEMRTTELVMKARPYESAPDVDTRYSAVRVDDHWQRTILTAPRAGGPHPAVLFLNGIGCFSQESLQVSSTDVKLLYGLTRAGFVTMRVEKSGIGDSEGPSCQDPRVDFEAEIRGYVAGLKALRADPGVDPSKVFVMGLSVGGVEAPIVAREAPVKGIVVLNTVAKPFLEYLLETRRRQGVLRGTPYDELDNRMRTNERCNHRLLVEREAPEEIVRKEPGCKDWIAYPAPYSYMRQWASVNPGEAWKPVEAPVLVVSGQYDHVAMTDDSPYLRDMINSFHAGHATFASIPDMDHYLSRVRSMPESLASTAGTSGEFQGALLDAVRGWLERESAAPSA
jgi:hypothetical protein